MTLEFTGQNVFILWKLGLLIKWFVWNSSNTDYDTHESHCILRLCKKFKAEGWTANEWCINKLATSINILNTILKWSYSFLKTSSWRGFIKENSSNVNDWRRVDVHFCLKFNIKQPTSRSVWFEKNFKRNTTYSIENMSKFLGH